MSLSPDLIAFLKAWHDWATSGAPEGEPFWRRHGLCPNVSALDAAEEVRERLLRELSAAFNCRPTTPFGYEEYWRGYDADTQHLCPKRLAWVRERLVEAGEMVS